MTTGTDFLRRVRASVGNGIRILGLAVFSFPVHCSRCRRVYKLGEHELKLFSYVGRHGKVTSFLCPDCLVIMREEYRFRCRLCGEQHNLPDFPICVICQADQYPREAKRVAEQNQRARVHGARATLTITEWLRILEDWRWSCCYCGKPFQALDHRIPVAKGGGTVASNCLPICQRCNSMKGSFHPDELLLPSPRSPEAHRRIEEYLRYRWPLATDTSQQDDSD